VNEKIPMISTAIPIMMLTILGWIIEHAIKIPIIINKIDSTNV